MDTLHAALHGNEPLWLVEGEKKALAVAQLGLPAVGFCGIENWHLGGSMELLPDFACISLRQRQLYLVPDGDAATNSAVRRGAERFAAALARCGAKPELVVLPTELPGIGKVGVDDYIVRKNATAEDLERLPRRTIIPLIHLVDIERTEHVGHVVQTDIVIAGVGETFHVPRAWTADCRATKRAEKCPPSRVDIGSNSTLLELCRTNASQLTGAMRGLSNCTHSPAVKIT